MSSEKSNPQHVPWAYNATTPTAPRPHPVQEPPPYSATLIRHKAAPEVISNPPSTRIDMETTIAATQAVNAAIKQNGRNPIHVVCPICKTSTLTQVTDVEDPSRTAGQSTAMVCVMITFALCVIGMAVGVSVALQTYIPLAAGGGMILFMVAGSFLACTSMKNASKTCADKEHRCGNCGTLLGVNSGAEMFQQMQMQAMYNNRRRY